MMIVYIGLTSFILVLVGLGMYSIAYDTWKLPIEMSLLFAGSFCGIIASAVVVVFVAVSIYRKCK